MKKIILILILILLSPMVSIADELGTSGIEGSMDYTGNIENAFAGQKQVSDEDFEKALSEVKAKKNKRKLFKKDKPFKGKSFNEENNGGYISDTADKNILLTLPVELSTKTGEEIPVGHYKIIGEKVKDSVYLNFYQSSNLIAKVPATETNSDFDEPEINFVKIIPVNENKIKIIFGSMDFNAYTYINIKHEISDTY